MAAVTGWAVEAVLATSAGGTCLVQGVLMMDSEGDGLVVVSEANAMPIGVEVKELVIEGCSWRLGILRTPLDNLGPISECADLPAGTAILMPYITTALAPPMVRGNTYEAESLLARVRERAH